MRILKLWLAALTLGMMLVLSGCSSSPPNDQGITTEVQAKLFSDSVLKTRDIRVSTEKGVVTLSGTVQTDLEKGAADNIAAQVKGVQKVVDQLVISGPVAEAAPEPAPPPAPVEQPRPARHAKRAHKVPAQPEPAEATPTQAPAAPDPAAAAPRAALESTPLSPPRAREPESITVPAGTVVSIRMIDGIDSSRSRPGEEFSASLEAPIVVDDRVIIRKGADARVRLVQSQSAGRMTGRSELQVELVSLSAGGQTYPVQSSVIQKQGASRGTRTAETVGGGAALGALIGAIAGHGKGAAIGAAVGAGAGTGVQAATKGQQIQIPPETKLDFTLKAPITVTM